MIFCRGSQTPQCNCYSTFNREGSSQNCVSPSQSWQQLVTNVHKGILAHMKVFKPILMCKYPHYYSIPPYTRPVENAFSIITCTKNKFGIDCSYIVILHIVRTSVLLQYIIGCKAKSALHDPIVNKRVNYSSWQLL